MEDKESLAFLMGCLEASGIPVVCDETEMEEILSQNPAEGYGERLIEKLVLTYETGDRLPDLSPSSVTFQDSHGKEVTMYSVKDPGQLPKDYVPKKTGTAYKLMEEWPDGTLHALFAGTQEAHHLKDWEPARGYVPDEGTKDVSYRGIQTMKLAPRFGWHLGTGLPSTHHLMGVGDILHPKMCYPSKSGIGHPKGSRRVWAEVRYDASNDYTPVAEQNPSRREKDIRGLVPAGGYYMFQESNLTNWIVASSVQFVRVIPEEERQEILKNAGFSEELVWRKLTLRKNLRGAFTHQLHAFPKKPEDAREKLLRLLDVAEENEERIQALSRGKEPVYPRDSIQMLRDCIQTLDEKNPGTMLEAEEKRRALHDAFAASHPAVKRQRLTRKEVEESRKVIRDGVQENAESLDREASLLLTSGTKSRVMGFVHQGTIYLDPPAAHARCPHP